MVDVKELFSSESKTQVYAHLHELMQSPVMQTVGIKVAEHSFQVLMPNSP